MEPTNVAQKLPQVIAALAGIYLKFCTTPKAYYNLCSSAGLGSFALGTAMAWTSPALPHIADCQGEEDCDFSFDENDGSWIGSLLNLGALPAALATGYFMSKFGRKWSMIYMSVPFTIGWIIMLLPYPLDMDCTTNKWLFYIGRLITGKNKVQYRLICSIEIIFYIFATGFAGGSFTLLGPVYSTEIAEGSIRGSLGSFMGLMVTVGALFDNTLGAFIHWYQLTAIVTAFPSTFFTFTVIIFWPSLVPRIA
jgi:MFS family permease